MRTKLNEYIFQGDESRQLILVLCKIVDELAYMCNTGQHEPRPIVLPQLGIYLNEVMGTFLRQPSSAPEYVNLIETLEVDQHRTLTLTLSSSLVEKARAFHDEALMEFIIDNAKGKPMLTGLTLVEFIRAMYKKIPDTAKASLMKMGYDEDIIDHAINREECICASMPDVDQDILHRTTELMLGHDLDSEKVREIMCEEDPNRLVMVDQVLFALNKLGE